jgi:hypothetical protein
VVSSEASGDKHLLLRGGRVEVRPYSRTHAFHYLAALDGERGTVKSIVGHGPLIEVRVLLDNPVGIPLHALQPIEED